jgi:3-oxoacyl-[acyl-carrier protein] reductase
MTQDAGNRAVAAEGTLVRRADRMKDKVTVITGAAKGIGRGIAGVFASEGATLYIADIDEAAGRATAADLSKNGATVDFVKLDVTDQASCEAAVQCVLDAHGRIDILCSNAGVYPQARVAEMTEGDWDRIFAINVKGMFFMVKAVLPGMRKRGNGRIVLTSSVTGPVTGYPGWAHYGATKAAMLGFMRSAAIEVAQEGVTINAVMPGNIMTEGMEGMGQEYIDNLAASIPMKKLGTPQDIGYAMLFLSSDEAAYITGQTIIVDGGQLLPEGAGAVE